MGQEAQPGALDPGRGFLQEDFQTGDDATHEPNLAGIEKITGRGGLKSRPGNASGRLPAAAEDSPLVCRFFKGNLKSPCAKGGF
jgi:hypothetical protein